MSIFLIFLCVLVEGQRLNITTPCHPVTYKGSAQSSTSGCSMIFSYDPSCMEEPSIQYCQYLSGCANQIDGKCLTYSVQRETNASKCKEKCCPVFQGESQQLYNVFQCELVQSANSTVQPSQDSTNGSGNSSAATASTMGQKQFYFFLGIFGLFIIIVTVAICYRCRECCRRRESQPLPVYQQQPLSQRGLTRIQKDPLEGKTWKRKPINPYITNQDQLAESSIQTCSICLNPRPNSFLDCNHTFHKECISEWLSRVLTCPLCKRNNLQSIEISCIKCLLYSYTIRISQLKASYQSQDICDQCMIYEN